MSDKIKSRFNTQRVKTQVTGESMAQQNMKAETDINTIVSRYMRTGQMGNPVSEKRPIFGDFTSLEFMDMQNSIADINQEFSSLPSRVRRRFGDDPHQLIRFVEKPENMAEAIKLGLIPEPPPDLDLPVEDPANPAAPPANPA